MAAIIDPSDTVQTNPTSVQAAADVTAQALSELRSLPTPAGDRDRVTAIYSAVDRVISLMKSEARALHSGQSEAARALDAQVAAAGRAADVLSNAYGLTTCGS